MPAKNRSCVFIPGGRTKISPAFLMYPPSLQGNVAPVICNGWQAPKGIYSMFIIPVYSFQVPR